MTAAARIRILGAAAAVLALMALYWWLDRCGAMAVILDGDA